MCENVLLLDNFDWWEGKNNQNMVQFSPPNFAVSLSTVTVIHMQVSYL